MRFVTFVTLSI